jgi:hypothetical protein
VPIKAERNDGNAGVEPFHHLGNGIAGLMPARALDEHGVLQPGGGTDQWPVGDLALGDKGDRRQRADHQYVGPGHVIGHEQHGAIAHRRADDMHADAQQRAEIAVMRGGQHAPARQAQFAEQPLRGDQRRRHGEEINRDDQ